VGKDNGTDARKTIADLLAVMAALRTPGTGCPWDLAQTFATIAPYTIEEAYEVADAIARGDLAHLEDELGDLLLQVVYHARMAEEQGAFDFADVTDAITRKMIRRHPHVFGTAEQREAGAQPGFWARIKAEEAEERDAPDPADPRPSRLDGVPVALPALTRAVKLQDKAARVGFDWPSLAPVFDKMREELDELAEVALRADPRGKGATPVAPVERARIEEELGDVLFVIANVARHLCLDPESALRGANEKFVRRFRFIEDELAASGKRAEDSSLAEMDALWDKAKAIERG
jgi:ATP diphosphatase